MAVTLLNVFIVPEGKEEEFVANWKRTAAHFHKSTPGFVETHLHRNTGVGNGTFQFINIARWDTADDWHNSHGAYRPTEYDIEGVQGHPAIFQDIVNMERGKDGEGRPIQWVMQS